MKTDEGDWIWSRY